MAQRCNVSLLSLGKIILITIILLCHSSDLFGVAAELQNSKAVNERAYIQLQAGNYAESFKISKLALRRAQSENNITEESRAYNNIASNFSYLGELNKALSNYLISLDLAYQSKNIIEELRAINNIANIYSQLKEYSETARYRELHLKLSMDNNMFREVLVSYIGLIDINVEAENFDKANELVNQSKRLLEDNPEPFIEIYFQMAYATLLEKEQRFDEAQDALKIAAQISKQYKYEGLIISSAVNIEEINFTLGKFDKVIKSTIKILKSALNLKLKTKVIQSHRLLAKAFEKTNQFKLALEHTNKANTIEVSRIQEKVRVLAEVTRIDRQMIETEEKLTRSIKDKTILVLQLEQQNKNQIIGLIIIITFVIIITSLFYRRNSKVEISRQRAVNKKLKELDRVKDRILKNTSHELRTPLNGIVGLSEVIIVNNENKIDESTLDMVRLIKSSGEQLSLIINDILDMSKSRSGEITIINVEFNLVELISDVINICKPLALDRDVAINFKQAINDDEIFLDKKRLRQILFNIIGNAVKFTNKGTVKITYLIRKFDLKLFIVDTGIAIPEDKIERILEGFEQVDSGDTRPNSGSGLGLAISRNICLSLGGNLEISSKINKGTNVTITLPLSPVSKV